MCRKREAAYRELQQRNDRRNNLSGMAGSMEVEKAVMVSHLLGVGSMCACMVHVSREGFQ